MTLLKTNNLPGSDRVAPGVDPRFFYPDGKTSAFDQANADQALVIGLICVAAVLLLQRKGRR